MLDDLRNSSSFEEEEPQEEQQEQIAEERPSRRGDFLGMTAPQRFILSLMLFFMMCVLGVLALVVFERVVLPFF